MTSFGWKRKIGGSVSRTAASTFQQTTGTKDNDEEVENIDEEDALKWVEIAKKRKLFLLEDAKAKSCRLKNEGTMLAEAERYWEAIKKWDEALQLTPQDENLLEMKSQALMILHEVFPAVQTAEKAVQANCRWWVAYQTLGRSQMGLGEIDLAIRSFSKAIHIKPDEQELWKEDLQWACNLRREKREKTRKKQRKTANKESAQSTRQSSSQTSEEEQDMREDKKGDSCHYAINDKNETSCQIGRTKEVSKETLQSSSKTIDSEEQHMQENLNEKNSKDATSEKNRTLFNIDMTKEDSKEMMQSSSQSIDREEPRNTEECNKGEDRKGATNEKNRTSCNIDMTEQDNKVSMQSSSQTNIDSEAQQNMQ